MRCPARISASTAQRTPQRVHPPTPAGTHCRRCGPFDFRVEGGDENKPRNILEEIVWWVQVVVVVVVESITQQERLNL
jgi:hypothetical protein